MIFRNCHLTAKNGIFVETLNELGATGFGIELKPEPFVPNRITPSMPKAAGLGEKP